MDLASRKGRFGWATFETNIFVPYLFRHDDDRKFFCLQMVEKKLFANLRKNLPSEIFAFWKVSVLFNSFITSNST
jgi:hypothetical protein